MVTYLGILCDIVEAGNVHAELASLRELSEANTERDELITSNTGGLTHHRLTKIDIVKGVCLVKRYDPKQPKLPSFLMSGFPCLT